MKFTINYFILLPKDIQITYAQFYYKALNKTLTKLFGKGDKETA